MNPREKAGNAKEEEEEQEQEQEEQEQEEDIMMSRNGVNPRDIAGNAEEEESANQIRSHCLLKDSMLRRPMLALVCLPLPLISLPVCIPVRGRLDARSLISGCNREIPVHDRNFSLRLGSYERHSKLKNRDIYPIEFGTKRRHSYSLTFL